MCRSSLLHAVCWGRTASAVMGVELGKAVMGLDMGPLGVLQHPPIMCLYSRASNQGHLQGTVKDATFPLTNLPLWSAHGQLGPGLAG